MRDEEIANRWLEGRYDASVFANVSVADGDETTVVEDPTAMLTVYIGLRADQPPLDDARVRQALAHSIDRQRYAERLKRSGRAGDPARTGGIVPPTVPGHSHRVAPEHDPERARVLLGEAGYPKGKGLPDLAMGAIEDWFDPEEVAEQLAEVGIRARVTGVPFNEFPDFVQQDCDAWVTGWAADFPDPAGLILPLLATYPVYRDARIDGLVERARLLVDQDERLAVYREIDRLLVGEHVALVPLLYYGGRVLRRPWVSGFWTNALATSTFADVVVRPELRSAPRSA